SRPALSIDFGKPGSIETLQLSFDANRRVLPEALVLDPASKIVIPIPVPNIAALVPPLGAVVPPAHRHQRLRDTAKLTAAEAAGALLAKAARSAEAMIGHGALDVARARVRLRAGAIVEVRGAAGELPASAMQPGVNQITLVTPGKHAVVISDAPGPAGGVSLRTTSGARITVSEAGIVIDNGKGASITLTGNKVHITGVMV